jgi:hypothetical protein
MDAMPQRRHSYLFVRFGRHRDHARIDRVQQPIERLRGWHSVLRRDLCQSFRPRVPQASDRNTVHGRQDPCMMESQTPDSHHADPYVSLDHRAAPASALIP